MTNREEELLLRLTDIMSVKDYYKFKFVFKESDYTITFPQAITLNPNRNYILYLKRFSVFNTIANIESNNNKFVYSPTGAAPWKTITITPGAYEIKQLNTFIQSQMTANGDYDSINKTFYISLAADEPTSKTIMIISGSYKVDFTVANSINSLFGFDPQVYSAGTNISQKIIQITLTNDIDIHCSLVNDHSFVNGVKGSILYSISAYSVPVGAKIIISEINPVYLPLSTKTIDKVRFELKDDNNKLLNFNGETIIIEIIVQQV